MDKYAGIPFYRTLVQSKLVKFRVVYKETDLHILAERDLSNQVLQLIKELRSPLETYIIRNPLFLKSLEPIDVEETSPEIIKEMVLAGKIAGVGPMASVAGAIAERVGKALVERGLTSQVVVENGGDVFLSLKKDATVGVFAGDSAFSGKIGILVKKDLMPCGVCTSSAKIGHSLSFGQADAVTVIHKNTAVADALATSFGNLMKSPQDFKKVINKAEKVKDIYGVLVIIEEKLLVWGKEIKLIKI